MSEAISNGVNGGQLLAFIERIEREESEKQNIADGIKEIYLEARGVGYDAKIIKKLVALRKKSADARAEEAELLRLYGDAIQMNLGI